MQLWGEQDEGGRPINPRNGIGDGRARNAYPRSVAVYGPAMLPLGMENPGSTIPSDGFSARPSFVHVDVSFGDHDGLEGRLMAVAQADMYNSDPNPFPAAGVYDVPGAWHAVMPLLRLQPTTSAHMGLSNPASGGGPAMLFHAPPVFGVQTTPIYAVGL